MAEKYIITNETEYAIIHFDAVKTTSKWYGKLYESFHDTFGGCPFLIHLDEQQKAGDLYYAYYLKESGMVVTLYATWGTTRGQIDIAKHILRSTRDVAQLYVKRINYPKEVDFECPNFS